VDEFCKAVEIVYSLMKVFEIWGHTVTSFENDSNSGSHFPEHVNVFLKLRQESSGYPSWVQSENDKDIYIDDYRRAEGIVLDMAPISKNAGQRNLAKLKLNSMWDKWAQNQNKNETNPVTSEK
jgi:hypothetical protein